MSKISAKIIADSISCQGVRITTFELEYPRFILSEFNTHRMISKNSASSRAIPGKTLYDLIDQEPAMPIEFGKNRPGMQATETLEGEELEAAKYTWLNAKESAIGNAKVLTNTYNVHKQVANRIVEPFMTMKTVATATEFNNFYHLRRHKDAQPEIQELANLMYEAQINSFPKALWAGEWHLPYVWSSQDFSGNLVYKDGVGNALTLEEAIAVSVSCCAQVSYRKNDDSLEKAKKIFEQLITSEPAHASPTEHQATPMPVRFASGEYTRPEAWAKGISHTDRNGDYWSGNFKGWIQYRKTLDNEAVWGSTEYPMF